MANVDIYFIGTCNCITCSHLQSMELLRGNIIMGVYIMANQVCVVVFENETIRFVYFSALYLTTFRINNLTAVLVLQLVYIGCGVTVVMRRHYRYGYF